MLDFESCQSLEKLVVDNEICFLSIEEDTARRNGIEDQSNRAGFAGDHDIASDHNRILKLTLKEEIR